MSIIICLIHMRLSIVSMIKGGVFNDKYGNKLMQARGVLQGVMLGAARHT